MISKSDLIKSKEDDLKRLSNYLKLSTEDYSHKHRAKLIYWLLTRKNYGRKVWY